ncbi:SDR family NAD(P)-dependent oxidoreductase [Pseudomaricurvus sp. HS19]|uniref:SDR family NAD(P)-dependent oxidoreductase n=1 Tax=Pseudomaricurvus sp. HS19 TaxID=2692626 RepID=UPI00136ED99A|nr:SDR family oxidoreductase [Pseudomaricurvus sp. HS19]MYM64171.1 SDR family oxidoreductase [Pseudomaricurvus sp. HS19]
MNSVSVPFNPFSLGGRVALVTGAASGIGAAIAAQLAQAGARVIIADLNGAAAAARADELQQQGYQAESVALDVSSEAQIVEVCAAVVARYGLPWLLVNNAGLQDRQSFVDATAEEWDRMNAVNARGPYLLSRELARAMIQRQQPGRIVNIASAALQGSIVHGLVAYTGSKAALLGLSQATAFELAQHGITVNTVLPGGVATPGAIAATGPVPDGPARRAVPLGMCQGEDIAAAVLYFASPAAQRVTNQVLAVDGGFSVT